MSVLVSFCVVEICTCYTPSGGICSSFPFLQCFVSMILLTLDHSNPALGVALLGNKRPFLPADRRFDRNTKLACPFQMSKRSPPLDTDELYSFPRSTLDLCRSATVDLGRLPKSSVRPTEKFRVYRPWFTLQRSNLAPSADSSPGHLIQILNHRFPREPHWIPLTVIVAKALQLLVCPLEIPLEPQTKSWRNCILNQISFLC